jgi:signal transduction histidine kinase
MELARPIRERVRLRADSKNVDVIFYCTCGFVWVQPHIFPEALYELLDNAIRANRDGHPVIVDVRNTREGDALWQVQDAGGGMSAQTLAALGVPCHGVARAWAIIETHDGLLSFESALGVGTTATIWLPKRLSAANTGHDEPALDVREVDHE